MLLVVGQYRRERRLTNGERSRLGWEGRSSSSCSLTSLGCRILHPHRLATRDDVFVDVKNQRPKEEMVFDLRTMGAQGLAPGRQMELRTIRRRRRRTKVCEIIIAGLRIQLSSNNPIVAAFIACSLALLPLHRSTKHTLHSLCIPKSE